jgi:hypothetical protein
MADKNRTPDILGSVLSAPLPAAAEAPAQPEAAPSRKASKQQNGKMVEHNTGKTVRQQDGEIAQQSTDKTVNQQNGIPANSQDKSSQADAEKVKATFYLAPEAAEGLEDAWLQLRRQARGANRKRAISKSEIVEMALQIMLEDLEAHGKESRISDKLLSA